MSRTSLSASSVRSSTSPTGSFSLASERIPSTTVASFSGVNRSRARRLGAKPLREEAVVRECRGSVEGGREWTGRASPRLCGGEVELVRGQETVLCLEERVCQRL